MFDYPKTYSLPFKSEIPNYTESFINNNSFLKLYYNYSISYRIGPNDDKVRPGILASIS